MAYYRVDLHTFRNGLRGLPVERRLAEGRRGAKLCLARRTASGPFTDGDVPDLLVHDDAARRYLEIEPPMAAILPEFEAIISEIEDAYVGGLYFAAVSAACVSIERMLNMARIELHPHHAKIKSLWGKGPSNSWQENIEALRSWGYLSQEFAGELVALYVEVRNRYLHSAAIIDLPGDALRSIRAAYKLLGTFVGFPEDLFRIAAGIQCLNPQDPRFKAFYERHIVQDAGAEVT